MANNLEALQQMAAVKQAQPSRCSSTCMLGTHVIVIN
jgi:hypothetical protein